MNLQELETLGALVSEKPVPREITFTLDDGVQRTATIHVKRMSIGEYERMVAVGNKHGRSAQIISGGILLGDGGCEPIPPEKAFQLHRSLAGAMLQEFTLVNGGGAKN